MSFTSVSVKVENSILNRNLILRVIIRSLKIYKFLAASASKLVAQNFSSSIFLINKQIHDRKKKLATGLCVPFVEISLHASFYSASLFLNEIRAREFAWPLKRHTVFYRLTPTNSYIQTALKLIFLENYLSNSCIFVRYYPQSHFYTHS